MATRTLSVAITTDTRSLNKGLDESAARTKKWSGRIAAAGLAAGTGLAVGLKKSAEAAIEAEKSQARLEAQLKASGISFRAHRDEIERVIQKHSQLSGLDDEDLQDAFTNIVRVTGDVDKGLRLTGLAADFARAKHMDVAKAGELVGKVAGGNTGILGRYGIKIKEGATATEALGTLQQKFAGQAEAYGKTTAGAGDRASVAWENLKETLGESLLPMLARVGDHVAGVLNWMQRNEKATKVAIGTVGAFVAVLGTVMVATKVAAALSTLRIAVLAVNAAMRANPIGLVITALALLATGLVAAYKKSETFRNVVNAVFRAVKNAAITAIDFILGGVQRFLEGLAKVFDAASKLPGVGKKFRGLADDVRGAAADVGRLRSEMRDLKSKRIKVDVDLAFNNRLTDKHPFAKGDGLGARVQVGAQQSARGLVPSGSANLMGADFDLGPFARIGAGMGLHVSSGLRPGAVTSSGNPSFHGTGDAIDMTGGPGPMMRFARTMKGMFGSRLRELIYTPMGMGIKDGRPFQYTGKVAQDHFDHVHVAYTGPFGDGIGDIRNLWTRAGGSAGRANLAAAVAMAESGGDPRAFNRNSDGSVDRGLWQINSVHGGLSTFDRLGNARAAVQISGGGRDWSPWVAFTNGSYRRFLTSGGGGGGARSRPMSPAARAREAFGRSQDRVSTNARNALKRAGSVARGPGKGVDRGGGMGPDEFAAAMAGIPATDFLDRDLAMAELSGDPAQIKRAQEAIRDYWQGRLDAARGTADPRDDTDAARGLKAALDALGQTLEDEKRAREEHTAALRGVEAELKRQTDLAKSTIATDSFQKSKWIADVLSGQLGRGISNRGLTPGAAVEVSY